MSLGNTIKSLRTSKKLTQYELAQKANISKNALWNYENDKREPRIEVLEKIAFALDVSMNDLLWPTDNDKSNKVKEFQDIIEKAFGNTSINSLLNTVENLNNDGVNKVINYAKDLSEMPKYQKENNITNLPKREKQIWEEPGKEYLMPIACHDDGLTDEEKNFMNKAIAEFERKYKKEE
ncbi:helix-turn-helix domain-containing protein [Clostridium perfringens]